MSKPETLEEALKALEAAEGREKKLAGENAARRREAEQLTEELGKLRKSAEDSTAAKTAAETSAQQLGADLRASRLQYAALASGFRDPALAVRLLDPAVTVEAAPAEFHKLAAAYPALTTAPHGGPNDAPGARGHVEPRKQWGSGTVMTDAEVAAGFSEAVRNAPRIEAVYHASKDKKPPAPGGKA